MSTLSLLSTLATATGTVFQMGSPVLPVYQASITGTGTCTATVDIEGSNDGNVWSPQVTPISLVGSGSDVDAFQAVSAWPFVRAGVSTITGTGARVIVTAGLL